MLMDFEGQRSGEEVVYVFRRHKITAIKGVFFMVFMILLGCIPMFIWKDDNRMLWVWLATTLIGMFGSVYTHILWYFSYYMLTNQRLRQVRQKGLFKKTVVDLDLDNILSSSYGQHGLFATIFNYGTILIQTSAGDLVLSLVSRPEKVYNEIEDAAHVARKAENESN